MSQEHRHVSDQDATVNHDYDSDITVSKASKGPEAPGMYIGVPPVSAALHLPCSTSCRHLSIERLILRPH